MYEILVELFDCFLVFSIKFGCHRILDRWISLSVNVLRHEPASYNMEVHNLGSQKWRVKWLSNDSPEESPKFF